MKLFLIILLTIVIAYQRNGIRWLSITRIAKNKISMQSNVKSPFDILSLFEDECEECTFTQELVLEKNHKYVLEYIPLNQGSIKVYLNNSILFEHDSVPSSCFFCILHKFK